MNFIKSCLYSLNLNWNITSDIFVKELFSEFCAQNEKTGVKNLQNSKNFFNFFNVFLTVLLHREKSDLFVEWFESQNRPVFWRSWFELCQDFFSFLESRKILHETGLKALLFSHLPLLDKISFEKERIFLDLSFSFDLCEKEIFKELSRFREIHILSPELEHKLFFEKAFNVYQTLEEELGSRQTVVLDTHFKKPGVKKDTSQAKLFKVKNETQLEEVEKAVVQVCKWLKNGVSPKDIALFAPDMEKYWFALKIYFERENIPVKKSVFAKLTDFPDIQYFLSALRVHLGHFSFEDLEYFSFFKEYKKDFSRFKTHYFSVPDRELATNLLFKNKIQSPNKIISGSQFIEWALSLWPKEAESFLLDTVSKVFLKCPMEESIKASAWMRLFESELLALEIEVKEEDKEGVSCLSFNALHSFKGTHSFVMGLDEESIKTFSLGVLNEADRENILNDLGFPLPLQNPREREHNLLWFLQSSENKEVYLSFSTYDFKGDIKTPSLLYFLSESLFSAETAEIQEKLLWNWTRKQDSLNGILSRGFVKKETAESLESAFLSSRQPFFHKEKIQLSSHRLKSYIDCPFKYAARNLFFVSEGALVERELSPISKGSIVHKLFENCLRKYSNLCPSSEQIEEMIEEVKPEESQFIHQKQMAYYKR